MAAVDRCDEIMALIDRVLGEEAGVSRADRSPEPDEASRPVAIPIRVRARRVRTSA
jgi:hypothetical protein